jgi:hypothetical protein
VRCAAVVVWNVLRRYERLGKARAEATVNSWMYEICQWSNIETLIARNRLSFSVHTCVTRLGRSTCLPLHRSQVLPTSWSTEQFVPPHHRLDLPTTSQSRRIASHPRLTLPHSRTGVLVAGRDRVVNVDQKTGVSRLVRTRERDSRARCA